MQQLLTKAQYQQIIELRKALHEIPELSGQEIHTRKLLMDFLKEHTSLTIVDKEKWFYAYHDEQATETIALRADHDAIVNQEGKAFHGCGHDGHSAIMCGVALAMETKTFGKNIVLIFQASEENGQGAKWVVPTLHELQVNRVYGLHNFPGWELGRPLIKKGTFMCASKGMNIEFVGKQSHASQPEKGNNPIYATARLIQDVESLSHFNGYVPTEWQNMMFSSMVLCTVVASSLGTLGAFGVSPAVSRLQLTLRAAVDEDLATLTKKLENMISQYAIRYQLEYQITYEDEFPDTTNTEKEVELLETLFTSIGKNPVVWEEPFRASEDFGWYLKTIPGSFFGIGAGEDHPKLHHELYEFPDSIILDAIQAFYAIISE